MKQIAGGVTAPKGFRAAGIHCGIKKAGLLDLALIASDGPAGIAGLFTTNRVVAAPVLLDRRRLKQGRARAVIVNSGNANACTGEQGLADARRMAASVAEHLHVPAGEVFVGSTGVIGRPLPLARIEAGIPKLVRRLRTTGGLEAARAIMTTDLRPKHAAVRGVVDGRSVTVGGMAKGSGMIHPNMATMLAYLTTDAVIDPRTLQRALSTAAAGTFNCISVDGDTSTNDTVLCLANGAAGNPPITEGSATFRVFIRMLTHVSEALALSICRDGEGVTKVVKIQVTGGRTDQEARRIANTVATSNLVKTALFGQDANWGRVMAAVGRAGVPIHPDRIDVAFGGIPMVKGGTGLGLEAERDIARVFRRREFTIDVAIGRGPGTAHVWTTDLSYDYVKINASYRS